MRIGIVTPVTMFPIFAEYFQGTERTVLTSMPSNEGVPVPSMIAKGLVDDGHFVRIFTYGDTDCCFKSEKIEIFVCNCNKGIYKFLKLGEFQRAFCLRALIAVNIKDLDLLHTHWTYRTALAVRPLSKTIPTFCTVRDWAPIIMSYLPNKGGLYWKTKLLISEYVFRCKRIHFIANSPYTKSLIDKKIKGNVPCIMNPISPEFLIEGAKVFPQKLKIISIFSSIDERKNPDSLLIAFKKVLDSHPDSELLFVINNKHIEETKEYKRWKEMGLLNNVRFLKSVVHDQLPMYLDECTMMVCTSREETFGNTIVEAMSRKLPVIGGTKSGAIPYLLEHGKVGYICNIDNPDEIVSTIHYVYNNISEAIIKSENAYKNLKSRHMLPCIVKEHIDYFSLFLHA